MPSKEPDKNKLKILARKDVDYEKQLERVLNEYTPQSDPKKKTYNSAKQKNLPSFTQNNEVKYAKTKYSAPIKERSSDFKKKAVETSTKPTIKKTNHYDSKKDSLIRSLRTGDKPHNNSMSTKKIMEINL